ncbi:hypothetical protein V9T40_006508 [Parthenolecanium corni]|uniref:Uncharacterized protein n=1 Tax=Parthenolecanium corni TaxID=536013 RepID=A0AAN9TMU9_9HEMI
MGQDVEYCNDKGNKEQEKTNQVLYETCGQKQKYTKDDHCKQKEEKCLTKYVAGCDVRATHHSNGSTHRSDHHRNTSLACGSTRKSLKAESGHCSKKSITSPKKSVSSLARRMSHCYEIKRTGRQDKCDKKPYWKHGKYVRDECGSGIVPKSFLFKSNFKLWCKTPLSMYQATIGELGRQILCQEIVLPRDVKSEPPSNIAEYIMPLCRGYYRKYDCMRPCEEEYAVVKAGKKIYRDQVERYWKPCLSKDQKHKSNVNNYAPQNAFLGLKLRRRNIRDDVACW